MPKLKDNSTQAQCIRSSQQNCVGVRDLKKKSFSLLYFYAGPMRSPLLHFLNGASEPFLVGGYLICELLFAQKKKKRFKGLGRWLRR